MSVSHVLIVDDESVIRLTLSLMMKKFGVEADVAEDGAAAEKIYQQNWQSIDLVILDQNMPDTSGAELYQKLKAVNPDIEAVLCSGFVDESEKEQFAELGLTHILNKPLSLADVKSLL